ncbi:MAG: hypothetical protein Q7N95_12300 [Alphaproteobacteria bacterium]|nr:hypothetical protein [Alphaproteobacteria bacterium]
MKMIITLGACVLMLAACGEEGTVDVRANMIEACGTKQGIGWLKREYGDNYCECWADQAVKVLSPANYEVLVKAVQLELEAADKADREKIYREHTAIYSTVAAAAKSCAKAK